MIRQFFLRNNYGKTWSLNCAKTGLLLSPSGLGYEMQTGYSRIGSSFIRDQFLDAQGSVKARIIFSGESPYIACKELIDYINCSDQLVLVYKTDAGEYLRDVDVTHFDKTEITEQMVLDCGIELTCKGLFYSNQVDKFYIMRSDGEMRWDFRWPARFNDYGIRTVNIVNGGHAPAPFRMEIYGYCENPAVIVRKDGKELHKVEFETTLQLGEKILYSSLDGDLYCYRVDAAGETRNFAQELDIRNTNFFKLPPGSVDMEFTSRTGATNNTNLTIYRFYKAV